MSAQSVFAHLAGTSTGPAWLEASRQQMAAVIERRLEYKRCHDERTRAFIEAHCIMLGEDCFLDSSVADDRFQEAFGLVYTERREGREIS